MAKLIVPLLLGTLLGGGTILKPNQWPKGSGKIILTFDDGPTSGGGTALLLDMLKRHNVKAAFFLIGRNVEQNGSAAKRILEEGHAVGNHTFSHRMLLLSSGAMNEEIRRGDAAVRAATDRADFQTKLFRAPYGIITPAAAWSREAKSREMAYLTFYANDAGADADDAPKLMAKVKKRLLKDRGGAVVFHEMRYVPGGSSNGPAKEWLPEAMEEFIIWAHANGLSFTTYADSDRAGVRQRP